MNRLILKYGYPLTIAILAVIAWVVYREFAMGGSQLIPFVVVAILVWGLGTCAFLYVWPALTYSAFKRAIVQQGLGGGPIPLNTLYAVPTRVSPAASNASLLATGTDDLLYLGGWLDLARGPLVLHVPEMAGRYYSVQFTDPSDGADFAYVGTRTTGTAAGAYLIRGPGWKGTVPPGLPQIAAPHNAVGVIGRVFVASDRDLPTAYGLAQQIQVTPLSH
jgi:hypothetical protein